MEIQEILANNGIVEGGPDERAALRNRQLSELHKARQKAQEYYSYRMQDNQWKFYLDKYLEFASKVETGPVNEHDLTILQLLWSTTIFLYPRYSFKGGK